MRMSEERINDLALKMAKAMIDRGAVESRAGAASLATLIAQVLLGTFKTEDEIDAEVRERLSRQRSLPPPGTGEYEAAFDQVKREVAQRRGFPL